MRLWQNNLQEENLRKACDNEIRLRVKGIFNRNFMLMMTCLKILYSTYTVSIEIFHKETGSSTTRMYVYVLHLLWKLKASNAALPASLNQNLLSPLQSAGAAQKIQSCRKISKAPKI